MLCIFTSIILLTATRFYFHTAAPTSPQKEYRRTTLAPPRTRKTTEQTHDAFYQTIIDTNIFRPLGWRKPLKRPSYQLIGTITGFKTKAVILDKQSNQLHTLTIGDKLGEATLTEVQPKHVTLLQKGQKTTLRLTQSFLR